MTTTTTTNDAAIGELEVEEVMMSHRVFTLESMGLVQPGVHETLTFRTQIMCKLYAIAVPPRCAEFAIENIQVGQCSLLLTADPIAAAAFVPAFAAREALTCVPLEPPDGDNFQDGPTPAAIKFDANILVGMEFYLRAKNCGATAERFKLLAYVRVLDPAPKLSTKPRRQKLEIHLTDIDNEDRLRRDLDWFERLPEED